MDSTDNEGPHSGAFVVRLSRSQRRGEGEAPSLTFDYFVGLPVPIAPLKVTEVTGTFAQFMDGDEGLKTASPSTKSPALRLGLLLLATLPLMTVSPVTDVVLKLTVALPAAHEIVAVRPLMEPEAQLALVVAGLGEMTAVPVTNLGTPGLAALPIKHELNLMVLKVTLCVFAVAPSPGLIVADPLRA